MSAIATMASPAQTARIRRTLGVCNRGAFSSPGGQGSLARWEIPSRTVLGDPRVGPPGVPSAHAVQPAAVLSRVSAVQPLTGHFPHARGARLQVVPFRRAHAALLGVVPHASGRGWLSSTSEEVG
jgi:hypothetical protein